VLGYVEETGQVTPEIKMQAEELVNIGYQRLLAFQRPDGGFDWWGNGPSLTFLSAYAVQEFHDMSRVYPIDGAIIEKARNFLFSVQEKDGSWIRAGATHGEKIERLPPAALTAYVAWSILETGFRDERTEAAIAYLTKNDLRDVKDNYVLALIANALVAHDKHGAAAQSVLDELASRAQRQDETVFWPIEGQTMYYGAGRAGDVETTALATYALIKGKRSPDLITKALAYLVACRRGNGSWGSTQATILALKAILQASASRGEMKSNAEITVDLNGDQQHVIVTPENWDVMQILDFQDAVAHGENRLTIRCGGDADLAYQVVGRYFIPWEQLPRDTRMEPIELSVDYDRTRLTQEDIIEATAHLEYNGRQATYMVIVTLGIPPGFIVDYGDFAELVGMGRIEKYDLNPRQVTLYIGDVEPGGKLDFVYHLIPKYPIKAKTARSTAYEYYNPDVRTVVEPVQIEVR